MSGGGLFLDSMKEACAAEKRIAISNGRYHQGVPAGSDSHHRYSGWHDIVQLQ